MTTEMTRQTWLSPAAWKLLGNSLPDDPLSVDVYLRGSKGERYHHSAPCGIDTTQRGSVAVYFTADFNGTVGILEIRRGDEKLCTVHAEAMDTPHIMRGDVIRVVLTP